MWKFYGLKARIPARKIGLDTDVIAQNVQQECNCTNCIFRMELWDAVYQFPEGNTLPYDIAVHLSQVQIFNLSRNVKIFRVFLFVWIFKIVLLLRPGKRTKWTNIRWNYCMKLIQQIIDGKKYICSLVCLLNKLFVLVTLYSNNY